MNKKQSGVTLFEILMALLIGAIVIAGAVSVLSNTIRKERLLSTEAEIQETLSYANNRLSFIFKEAMSSPCGNLENMLATANNSAVSKLKIALLGGNPQPINVILQQTASSTIGQNDFPMLIPGIAGHANEPVDNNNVAFSTSLPNIVAGSEYLIAMEISEKIIINSTDVNGIGGGSSTGGIMTNRSAIPTSNIETGVGSVRVPFIITDCDKADIFRANANVTQNSIPVANNLAFHAYYKPNESVISPVNFYAYYIAADASGTRQLRRRNLNLGLATTDASGNITPAALAAPQTLVEGITSLQFEWGLGTPNNARVQGFFTTQDILDNNVAIGNFRRNVISVRTQITAQGANNTYLNRDLNRTGSTTTVTTGQLSRTATHTYTIRNKMQRI